MAFEPCLGPFDELEELFGLVGAFELCLAAFLAHPAYGCTAVAIDGHLEALLVEQGEGMYDGKELAYVVGAVYRTKVEYLLAVPEVYATVLHGAGVAAAGGIYGEGIDPRTWPPTDPLCPLGISPSMGRSFSHRGLRSTPLGGGVRVGLLYIFVGGRSIRALGLLLGVERFVHRSLYTLYLGLAVVPTMVDTGVETIPNDVEFLLLAHTKKGIKGR